MLPQSAGQFVGRSYQFLQTLKAGKISTCIFGETEEKLSANGVKNKTGPN
jgi:hypothetical protein